MKTFLIALILAVSVQSTSRADCIAQYQTALEQTQIELNKHVKRIPLHMVVGAIFLLGMGYYATHPDGYYEGPADESEFYLISTGIGAVAGGALVIAYDLIDKQGYLKMIELLEEAKSDAIEKPLVAKLYKKMKRKGVEIGSIDELSRILRDGNESESFCHQESIHQLIKSMQP